MNEVICKNCGASDYVKNGRVRGLQRYRCKPCGYNFTATKAPGKPASMKALAVLLYAMGNMSFCDIARLLGVSAVSVMNWVRQEARGAPKPVIPAEVKIVQLDEMHNFLKKRRGGWGSGEPMILSSGELWPGFWVGVMMQPVVNASNKSPSRVVFL